MCVRVHVHVCVFAVYVSVLLDLFMLTRILSTVIVLKTKIIVSTVNKSMVKIILSTEIKQK